MTLICGPGIASHRDLVAGWHSISCICDLCKAIDEHVVGMSDGWGYGFVDRVEYTDHPYWGVPGKQLIYAGGYRPDQVKQETGKKTARSG
jgi:hypothetical protein